MNYLLGVLGGLGDQPPLFSAEDIRLVASYWQNRMPSDPSQLGPLYAAHAPALTLYARQWVPPALAEDAVHEAFVNLLSLRSNPDNPKAWLFTAVRNAAITLQRSRQRRDRRERDVTAGRPEWFSSRPEDLIDAATAEAALQSLDATSREIVVLRIWARLGYAEIAAIVKLPLSTVHDRYKSALTTLKQKMESTHVKPR